MGFTFFEATRRIRPHMLVLPRKGFLRLDAGAIFSSHGSSQWVSKMEVFMKRDEDCAE